MLPLDIKQSGGKLLPHSDLRGGGVFLGEASRKIHRELDGLISQIYFWNKTLHVSDSSSVHHQDFFSVQWKTPDDGQRNCPKHVEFYSKNKFEKLVHLVGLYYKNWIKSVNVADMYSQSRYSGQRESKHSCR